MSKLNHIIRALRYRNFRFYFTGQAFSLVGTWMQQMAVIWMVYRLTDSYFLLGAVTFSSQIPTFLIGPLAGVVADRYNRKKVLLMTQILSTIQAILLSLLVFFDVVHIWHVLVLTSFLGIINSFDISARQAFIIQMVDDQDDLNNAVALNSSLFNMAWLVGPTMAGLLISLVGEAMVFMINAGSYFSAIISLLFIKVKQKEKSASREEKVWRSLKDGFHHAFSFQPIRTLLRNIAAVSFFGMPFITLMPAFAKDILQGGANTLGYLMGASGVGAFVGAIFLAQRRSVVGLAKIMVYAMAAFCIGLITFSFSTIIAVSLSAMFVSGLGLIITIASCNILLHTIVEEDKRGRIMSLYAMAILGLAPVGSLLAGSIAELIGVKFTLASSAFLCGITIIFYVRSLKDFRELVAPIYKRKGIIPQFAKGLHTTTHPPIHPKD